MRRCVDDPRFPDCHIENVEVFTFTGCEKETVLNYIYEDGVWDVWSTVPSHITKLMRLNGGEVYPDAVNENGRVTAVRGKLSSPSMVGFRNISKIDSSTQEYDLEEVLEEDN